MEITSEPMSVTEFDKLLQKYEALVFLVSQGKGSKNKKKLLRKKIIAAYSEQSQEELRIRELLKFLTVGDVYFSDKHGKCSVAEVKQHHGRVIVMKNEEDKLIHFTVSKFEKEFLILKLE